MIIRTFVRSYVRTYKFSIMKEIPATKEKPRFKSPEEKFKREIDSHFSLWVGLIDDAPISTNNKEKMKRYLTEFKDNTLKLKEWDTEKFIQNCYLAIRGILSLVDLDSETDEAKALFYNLRDDLWDLEKEMR